MAVEVSLRQPAAVSTARIAEPRLSFSERRNLAARRRRLQRLQQGLVTASWIAGSAMLLALGAAGVVGLR